MLTCPQQWVVREFQMGSVENTDSFLLCQDEGGGGGGEKKKKAATMMTTIFLGFHG